MNILKQEFIMCFYPIRNKCIIIHLFQRIMFYYIVQYDVANKRKTFWLAYISLEWDWWQWVFRNKVDGGKQSYVTTNFHI
jgi:hypothetical protein